MKQIRAKAWLVFFLSCTGITGMVQAQSWYHYAPPPSEFDWELFAPLSEFDLGAEAKPSAEGYFFSASRMHFWTTRPGTTPIGAPVNARGANLNGNPQPVFNPNVVNYDFFDVVDINGTVIMNDVLLGTSDGGSFGLQFNSVSDAVPESPSGWGNRLEFGWVQSDTMCDSSAKTGWMVSILTGLDTNETYRLGFDDKRIDQLGASQGLPGIDGVPSDGINVAVGPTAAVPGDLAIPYIEGLTTVHINFADPFDLLLGFVDTNGDLAADDLDGDGVITPGDFFATGAGDQSRLGVVFDDLEFYNRTKLSGVELLAVRRKKKLHGNASAEMFLGARYLELSDSFGATGRGGILADSQWQNNALNRIVGPEFGLRVVKRSRRWSTVMSGRFMAGANLLSIRQSGSIGDHLGTSGITGATQPGLPYALGGVDFINRLRDEHFSPVGEFRLQSTFHVTRGVSLKAGWEGLVVGGVARGSNTIDYALPKFGINSQTEEIFSHGVTFGVEVNR